MPQKTPRDYRELLRSGRWFRAISVELQDALLTAATLKTLAANELLFARGDAPSGLYAVVDGAVRISGVGESGKEALLTMTLPPAWFGEISVFDELPRTHDAVAEQDSLLVHVSQSAVHAIFAAEPKYWRELGLLVAGKLRLTFLAMEDTALFPVAVRLARRLVMIAEGYGEWHERRSRVVEVSQEQLAMMLSASRQTVNGLLKELEAKKLVQVSYGSIEILDLEALKTAAQLEKI